MNIDFSRALAQIESMLNNAIGAFPSFVIACLIFVIFYILAKAVRTLIRQLVSHKGQKIGLAILLGRLTRWSLVLLGLLIGFVVVFPDFSPSKLFEILGLGGIAVGFGLRDLLQNFVSGILLLLAEPFRIGDQIIVNGFEGTVENIEVRATTIKTYDGRRVVIPNMQLMTSPVTVNTAYPFRRVEYDLGIAYEEDIEAAKSVILDTLKNVEEVVRDPAPQVIVVELGDFSVKLRVRWWIEPSLRAEAINTRDQVLALIKYELEVRDIVMPYPTQKVMVERE